MGGCNNARRASTPAGAGVGGAGTALGASPGAAGIGGNGAGGNNQDSYNAVKDQGIAGGKAIKVWQMVLSTVNPTLVAADLL